MNMTPIDPSAIDFKNLSTLISNVAGIFPGIITLVISVLPLYIVNGIIYLILGIFGSIVIGFAHMWK